jgi:predicted small secreted protein
MKNLFLLMLAVLFLMITTVGCNTARGAKEDMHNAGEHVEDIVK